MGSLASAGLRGGVLVAIAATLGALVVSGSWSRTDAAATSMYITPASQTVNQNETEVTVEVGVNDVAGMASWEFILQYDTDVVSYVASQMDTAFLSGAGGVTCPGAIIDEDEGSVRLGCNTIVGYDAPGVSGSGKFASITFKPKGPGKSPLVFTKISLSNARAEDIPAGPTTGVIRVLGSGESKPSKPEATPTVNYDLLTPTPIAGAVSPEGVDPVDPNTGVAGQVSTRSGSGRSGVAGARAGTSRSGSGSGSGASDGASEDFPIAGHGPQSESTGWPRDVSIALAVMGAMTLAGGAAIARRNAARAQDREG
jgi:hypothetical protein